MQIFGRDVAEGAGLFDDGRTRVDYAVDRIRGGWRISGMVRGRPGRIEIYRAPAPPEFLLNNWQSWGPMRKVKGGDKLEGAAERMAKQGRTVFSPVPDVFLRDLVSDYFAAWEGGLAGFLASRVGHPYFAVEGGDLAGYIEYFDTPFEDPVPLEPLVVVEGGPIELLLEEYGIRVAAENGVGSIAFPAISCGVYGYPIEAAAGIATRECAAAPLTLERIVLVAFGSDVERALRTALQ